MEQARRTGLPVPDSFKNVPELFEGLDLYLTAFMELQSCRFSGSGYVAPISFLTMVEYCEKCGVVGEQAEDLIFLVSRMDEAYLRHLSEKTRAERELSKHAAKAGRNKR